MPLDQPVFKATILMGNQAVKNSSHIIGDKSSPNLLPIFDKTILLTRDKPDYFSCKFGILHSNPTIIAANKGHVLREPIKHTRKNSTLCQWRSVGINEAAVHMEQDITFHPLRLDLAKMSGTEATSEMEQVILDACRMRHLHGGDIRSEVVIEVE